MFNLILKRVDKLTKVVHQLVKAGADQNYDIDNDLRIKVIC